MANIPFSTSTNPYTLSGTGITETDTDMKALAVRVHLQNINNCTLSSEVWYNRNSTWALMALPPLMSPESPIQIEQRPFQPATCRFTLYDNNGDYLPENLNSTYNYVSSTYDPLLDVNRKMLVRLGVKCYNNLASGVTPTASRAVDSGALANLTDGVFADFTGGTPLANHAGWTTTGSETITITMDLGSSKSLWNCVARFGTRQGAYLLPTSVNVQVSTNGSSWSNVKGSARPLSGDYADDYDGRAVEAIVCFDGVQTARYIRFQIAVAAAQSIVLDEIAVYGGSAYTWYGRNLFTGYLGDFMEAEASGKITINLTDTLKKLADNNSVYLTPTYENLDLADIASYLLTTNGLWARYATTGYDNPVSTTEIGWYGTKTNLVFPIFQGAGNSILGYLMELWQGVGYNLYADGNGYFQARQILSTAILPDRVFSADPTDSNSDAWHFVRQRSARNLRNSVWVSTGRVSAGGGSLKVRDPNSIAKYGELMMNVQDPVINTPTLQLNMASLLLRDYAWRTQTASCTIRGDFDTLVKQVYGFRMPIPRLSVYPKASTTNGDKRLGELWQADSLTHRITTTYWESDVDLAPYSAGAQNPPFLVSLASASASGKITATFTAITNPKVASVQIWVSTSLSDPSQPYTLINTISNSGSPTTIDATGLTNGTRYYVYLKTVDSRGMVSTPSNGLSIVCGAGGSQTNGWQVTDLAVSLTRADSTPDSQGYYTYSFQLAWTSPPGYAISNPANGGFKRMSCHMNIGKTCTITRVSTTATVSCTAHGFSTGDSVIIAGATPSGYNGTYTVTVVDANTFTYTCSGALATPATGNIYCAFAGDWTGNGNPWDGGKWDFGNPSWDLSTDYVPPGMSADRVTPGQLYLNVRFKTTTPFSGGQVLFYKMWTSWKNTEFVGYFPSNVASLTL